MGTIQRRCLPCHWFLFRTQWSRWNQHSKISDLPKSNGFNQISTLCNHATLMPTTMTRVPGDNSCDHFMLLPKGHLSKHLWGHHSAGRSTRIYTSTSHGNINTSPRMIYRDPPLKKQHCWFWKACACANTGAFLWAYVSSCVLPPRLCLSTLPHGKLRQLQIVK